MTLIRYKLLSYMFGFNLGHKKPTISQLQNFVIPLVTPLVTPKLYELAIELFNVSDFHRLNAIERASATDLTSPCTEMFKFWLQKYEDATWDRLIRALKAPGLQLHAIALDIMREVVKG